MKKSMETNEKKKNVELVLDILWNLCAKIALLINQCPLVVVSVNRCWKT